MSKRKKERIETFATERNYYLMGLSMLSSMVTYDFGEDIKALYTELLEWSLLKFGFCAIAKKDDKFYIGHVASYDFDEHGLPVGCCIFTTRHGYQFDAVIGENCVIGYNNNIRTPELFILKFAELLTETDKSIKVAIQKTRLNPIPLANDSKVAKALVEVMQDIEDGKNKVVMKETRNVAELAQDNPRPPLETVSLTSPEDVTRIQYLSRLHDDLLKRVCTFYGHSLSGVNKMAQVNSDELKGYETFSKIYPYILLEARKRFIDECNEVFGVNWSCDFSKAWEHLKETKPIEMVEDNAESEDEDNDTE